AEAQGELTADRGGACLRLCLRCGNAKPNALPFGPYTLKLGARCRARPARSAGRRRWQQSVPINSERWTIVHARRGRTFRDCRTRRMDRPDVAHAGTDTMSDERIDSGV